MSMQRENSRLDKLKRRSCLATNVKLHLFIGIHSLALPRVALVSAPVSIRAFEPLNPGLIKVGPKHPFDGLCT